MSNELIIDWPEWNTIINEKFIPLIDNRDRYLVVYGGRGSSKSDAMAKKLIYRCINEPYFRCLLVRREYSTIKESSYQTLKDIIFDLGLEGMFNFNVSPLEITCINGNRFIARGCDDVSKLKSVKDISCAWYEEDIPTHSDFITITTSIRTSKAEYLQELFTINPEVEGTYTENWFWKYFFEGHDELSFSSSTDAAVDDRTTVKMSYTCHHSTYSDNRWITPEFVAFLHELKKTNAYYWQTYCLGKWGNKVIGGQFFKLFSIEKNVAPTAYRPSLPLWVSFDFNTSPGVSCGIFQVKDMTLSMISEIQLPTPRNTTSDVCREICRKYNDHVAGMFVTGDAAGKHSDTRSEKGFNDYTIILNELRQFHPSNRTPNLNPPIVPRGNFINSIFEAGSKRYRGVEIIIGDKCTKMINDLLYLQEAGDGTTLKQRVKDNESGATYERYGHFGDLFSYVVCTIFANEFSGYTRPNQLGAISYGKNVNSKLQDAYSGAWTPKGHASNHY